ncbi:MAG: hypothetical protein GXP33_12105 [Spirochaetes bacterium]|nr:hypothetical protein [Spirochaetota bacterium]
MKRVGHSLIELVLEKSLWFVLLSCALAVVINGALSSIIMILSVPLFMDSIGTAVIAALFGLVPGIMVGLLTNGFIEVLQCFPGTIYPFGLVGAGTAIVVALMVKNGRFSTVPDAIVTFLIVVLVNAVLGAIIATFVFGGVTGVSMDYLTIGLFTALKSMLQAAFWARIPVNLMDKGIAVTVAYMVFKWVHGTGG